MTTEHRQLMNPANGESLGTPPHTELHAALRQLELAHSRFLEWRHTTVEERSVPLRRAAALLNERAHNYAVLMAEEMGKPLREGVAEIKKCASTCEYYAQHAHEFLMREPINTDAARSYVSFEPLGVVLAIMPWNFPFWQVFRFFAPSVMAGNTALLKHASNVPRCSKAIEALCLDAGFVEGTMSSVFLHASDVGELIDNERTAAVTLTGSEAAGRSVAQRAGQALKKCVLELGGSDPYVILEDANVPAAAESSVHSRLINSGQSCIAAKRLIVVRSRLKEFEARVVELMADKTLGDPKDERTDIGPLARVDLRDKLHQQVTRSVEAGATLRLGGEVPDRAGAWYPPTILSDVHPGMPAFDEELFGPVAAIIPAADDVDALQLANQTRFGLGAAVFTQDDVNGELVARTKLEAGSCFVNTYVRSDPRLPFGGIKQSGFGRELGPFGIREFVNVKTVYVDKPRAT